MEFTGKLTREAIAEDAQARLEPNDLLDMGVVIARHAEERMKALDRLPKGWEAYREVTDYPGVGRRIEYTPRLQTGVKKQLQLLVALVVDVPGDRLLLSRGPVHEWDLPRAEALSVLLHLAVIEQREHTMRAERAKG